MRCLPPNAALARRYRPRTYSAVVVLALVAGACAEGALLEELLSQRADAGAVDTSTAGNGSTDGAAGGNSVDTSNNTGGTPPGGTLPPTTDCDEERPCTNPGAECCSQSCIDVQFDRNHCGACDAMCAGWEDCQAGACVPFVCDAVPTQESDNGCYPGELCHRNECRCGSGASCGDRGECVDDACICGDGETCASGQSCCGDGCASLNSDLDNCGACGNACEAPADACQGGACICTSTGHAPCDGSCVDVDSDPQHCGACGNTCGEGQTCCGGSCVDTSSDASHCGACGSACNQDTANHCVDSECRCGDEPECSGGLFDTCTDGLFSGWGCGSVF